MLRFVVCLALALIGISCALLLAAWLFGRAATDRWSWSQWLLWIPTPAAIIAATIGLATALRPPAVRRKRRLARWAIVLAAVVAYFTFVEHRFVAFPPDEPGGLKLVHWTVGEAVGKVRSVAAPTAADVVALDGDVTILSSGIRHFNAEAVNAWVDAEESRRRTTLGPFLILTRLPIIERRVLVSSDEITVGRLVLDASAELGRPIVIYLYDLPSRPRIHRASIAARTRRLLADAGAGEPDIAVGDFNMTRGGHSLREIASSLHDAYDDGGHGYGATYHASFPLYHIDHVLIAPDLECTRYDLVSAPRCRHRGQVAWIEVRK